MNKRVAAVERNGQKIEKNLRPTEPGGSRAAGDFDVRFAYPGGSRPLEGYTIKRGVGHGGFGEVYFATSDAGKEVALKLIRRNFDVELRGIRHCLNLKHPNLLAIYDLREDDKDDKWVVMEYVTGDRLDDLVASHPDGMPIDDVLAWIHGIGAGVAYLHDHGIVHRDLKPGNVFCDEGVVKIGDYGLSKFISCSRRSGQTESVGTVHYMAPEVANGRYGKEIDIYALGIILYEMLTGRVPFEGESVGEVLMKHLTATPDVSMLAEPYRSVVARALEKDPARRFRSVPEMLAALPQPSGPQVHVGPWPSRAGASAASAAGGSMPYAAPIPVAGAADQEPILRAVRRFCGKIQADWNESNLNPATKNVILVGLLLLLLFTAWAWIYVALWVVILYACYWVARKIVLAFFPSWRGHAKHDPAERDPGLSAGPAGRYAASPVPPGRSEPMAQADARSAQPRRLRHPTMPRWARHQRPAEVLMLKPLRERITELVGSLLTSSLVAMTMCLMLMMMVPDFRSGVLSPIQLWAWLVLVSIAGTWAVLIPSKFWEGRRGESIIRRFTLMAAGLGVGAFAALMASFLKIKLPYVDFLELYVVPTPSHFYSDGTPLAMAYMACFAALFFVIRWWRQADPLRRTRLGLWSVLWSVLVACVIAGLLDFPQYWLMMAACAMSVSLQLSSSWLPPHRRHAAGRFD